MFTPRAVKSGQKAVRSALQSSHLPQTIFGSTLTTWPTLNLESGPTSSMTPPNSWPKITGLDDGYSP